MKHRVKPLTMGKRAPREWDWRRVRAGGSVASAWLGEVGVCLQGTELKRAALTNITAPQMLQVEHGKLPIRFRWTGVDSFRIPEDVLLRYGVAIELDFVAVPASAAASNTRLGA